MMSLQLCHEFCSFGQRNKRSRWIAAEMAFRLVVSLRAGGE
jgi:hypothetical protein